MNFLAELRHRFDAALAELPGLAPQLSPELRRELQEMIRPSQDAKFGDYQANLAMPLGKRLSQPPREVAQQIVDRLHLDDLCQPPEIAGPGFINLRLRDDLLSAQAGQALADPRLGIAPAAQPRTVVIDYSAPNVAKPMHVGHIRSTVIGDALYRTLKFLGHQVIGDNHLGDWGTQFGMIIFGYKHLLDRAAYQAAPVDELARLYRLVNSLVEYFDCRRQLPQVQQALENHRRALAQLPQTSAAAEAALSKEDKARAKAQAKERRQLKERIQAAEQEITELKKKQQAIETDPARAPLVEKYPQVGQQVLEETARLHAGDAENRRLWNEFLPPCLEALNQVYRRLGVRFDFVLGESFYHDRLSGVVQSLLDRGLARTSEGAVGVFLPQFNSPLLIQKQDGAFLYATTDLATLEYRRQEWSPSAILYVVDHRQSLHFEQLFATARLWGFDQVELTHISFGTVLGQDGRPYKTRSGDTVGLSGLLDEAVSRALDVVKSNDEKKPDGPELSPAERQHIAEVVGLGALKYADLSQNRTSDYVFSYEKMLAMEGNTGTYLQYAYARVRNIFAKGQIEMEKLRGSGAAVQLTAPAERALAVQLLRLAEALDLVLIDYRPNQLTSYLYELSVSFSTFYNECPVLKAPSESIRNSRLLLCDLTGRTLAKGLELLGIQVVEKM